jgi:4-hydroxyphenylpyruvate dioxygenase
MKENPIGLDGLEFIEFASPKANVLENLMAKTGMTEIGQHKSRKLRLYRQNRINFIINDDANSFAASFAKVHGPSVCSTGFRVRDAKVAFEKAVARGARPFGDEAQKSDWNLPAVYGIGDSLIYFVDQYPGCAKGHGDEARSIYPERFDFITDSNGVPSSSLASQGSASLKPSDDMNSEPQPAGFGFSLIDHMTNNVPVGEMQKWCDFYQKIFGFEERRYFDIKGKTTGLISKVMRSPCEKICIPINEPTDPKSQIQEYLNEYKGSGIQHIALLTEDICQAVSRLRELGVDFLSAPPTTYYEKVPVRMPTIQENISRLQGLGILADGDAKGYLLQIFTKNQVGPIFMELIQRRGHDGFGEGNFQALFDSIEEDQRQRGVL